MTHTRLVSAIERLDPEILQGLDIGEAQLSLVIQIKGSDVHPSQRHPDFFYQNDHPMVMAGKKSVGQPINKKTQVDITAPMHLPSGISPTSALFTSKSSGIHQPVRIFHPKKRAWMDTYLKIQPQVMVANGPAPDQTRLLLGGTDPDSWSSELWGNMGHHEDDRNAFIIIVKIPNQPPICFSLPRDGDLEHLLMEHGSSSGRWEWPAGRFFHMDDTPRSKAAVVEGPNSEVEMDFTIEFVYIVTNPMAPGWVKIGKTTQNPSARLGGYKNGPIDFDMNYILPTSNCDSAEKDIIARLDLLGVQKKGNEWYKLGSLLPARGALDAAVSTYPCNVPGLKPFKIINNSESWVFD